MTGTGARRAALERLLEVPGVTRVTPPFLLPADPFFELAGEEFARAMLLTTTNDGHEYCLRPDFTLPIASAYLSEGLSGAPAAFSYLGPIFRQREDGPAEFEQAGLELLGQTDADGALDQVFGFAGAALAVYEVSQAVVRLGSVALFEALLAGTDMPDVWRPRIRHRFGHPQALARLLDRLADPHRSTGGGLPWDRTKLIGAVAEKMAMSGLSPNGGRSAIEIADRYLEKQKLAAAAVPGPTLGLLKAYLGISGDFDTAMAQLEALGRDHAIALDAPIERLRRHAEALAAATPPSIITFDAGFAPRLDYYTGIVFEMTGTRGHVLASGGEYGRLLGRLGAPSAIAASGCAVWVDRLGAETEQ